jgi:O-acetyl-ADP-ribose deacetylase (regulator of RNase III)
MIKEITGNLFQSNAEAFVNAVNCVGVMGKGIALQFKQKFPAEYFNAYKIACQNGELAIGNVYQLKNVQTNPRYIINFPNLLHCGINQAAFNLITMDPKSISNRIFN